MPALRGLARYQSRYVVTVIDVTEDPGTPDPFFWFARFEFTPSFSVVWPTGKGEHHTSLGPLGLPRLRIR